ncbi:single-stranded-DNA-specific exonuclease RecJ [Ammoniphilus oxalaticus]|uniref:Single-stranded-DNA-specific exonuclease RecJ n=1 Tax=Ammoniphilus oxalaticus TaxID=66863 RepID=A0A419SJZ6_9BACL|nr:single-stranded-DNA-specific exonuclease RecJ [Ammoniphilus oxalaticus]RKD24361.1 single-stranded-DNA-specific exonuclease RecJ [Ammoniphilus oxalaticus]
MLWMPYESSALPTEMGEWLLANQIPLLFGSILKRRGVTTPAQLEQLFHGTLADVTPSTAFGPQIFRGVERLRKAFVNKEKVVIVGDYDADGTTAAAVIMTVLNQLKPHYGFEVDYLIPDRFTEGYGLNDNNLPRLLAMNPQLVITVDCGVSSDAQIQNLKQKGIDTIVTDHHEPKQFFPKHAHAVIHPMVTDYPDPNICGCTVAYQFMKALWECNGKQAPKWVEEDLLDLVAVGTVCDIMPLQGDNRILVRIGMEKIMEGKRLAFKLMKERLGWKQVNANTLGFSIGPRINAAGRMKEADPVVHLLLSNDAAYCASILDELETRNNERKAAQEHVVEIGLKQAQQSPYRHLLAIIDDSFHEGVVGIAASKIMDQYYRPTFCLAKQDGVVKGSARSIEGVHLFQLMEKHQHLLGNKWGGHAAAAGMTFEDESLVEPFFKALDEELATYPSDVWQRINRWDASFSLNEIADLNRFFEVLTKLEPFGQGFPEITWAIRGTLLPGRMLKEDQKIGKLKHHSIEIPFAMWSGANRAEFHQEQTYYGQFQYSDYWKSMQIVPRWVD